MRIERVDEKTVKCFLSNQELEEYDINYKDFVLRSEKAKAVVKEIIEQAEEKVGYKPPQFAFDLQIMMLPDQGLLLTFSEKEPFEGTAGEQILEYLRQMKNILQKAREKIGSPDGSADTAGAIPDSGSQPARPEYAVFAFPNAGSLLEYAAVLPKLLRVQSSLYFMDGTYYLYLKKGGASYPRYSKACIQALEFASLYTAEKDKLLLLQEHGECLIADRALKKLRAE